MNFLKKLISFFANLTVCDHDAGVCFCNEPYLIETPLYDHGESIDLDAIFCKIEEEGADLIAQVEKEAFADVERDEVTA